MKQTAIRYGLYASAAIVAISAFNFFILSEYADYTTQEVAGYLTMLLAMAFVFFGIRQYRDRENGGYLSFGQGLQVGVLIALIPSVFFGLFDILYTEVINPGWMDQYYTDYIERLRRTADPSKLQAQLESAQRQKEMFSKPWLQFLLMGGTVFVIGVIVSIISALALRRNKAVTA